MKTKIASEIASKIFSSTNLLDLIKFAKAIPIEEITGDKETGINFMEKLNSPDLFSENISDDMPENVNRPIPSDDEELDDEPPAPAPAGYDKIDLNDDFEPDDDDKWDPNNPVDEDGKVIKWYRDRDFITVDCGGKIWLIENICSDPPETEGEEGARYAGRCSKSQWRSRVEKWVIVNVDSENIEKHLFVKISDCNVFFKCVTITPIKRQKYRCVPVTSGNRRGYYFKKQGRAKTTKSVRTRTITINCCSET